MQFNIKNNDKRNKKLMFEQNLVQKVTFRATRLWVPGDSSDGFYIETNSNKHGEGEIRSLIVYEITSKNCGLDVPSLPSRKCGPKSVIAGVAAHVVRSIKSLSSW